MYICICMNYTHNSGGTWVLSIRAVLGYSLLRWDLGTHYSAGTAGSALTRYSGTVRSVGTWVLSTRAALGYAAIRRYVGTKSHAVVGTLR